MESLLEQWLADEAALKARHAAAGAPAYPTPEAMAAMDGLALMRAMLAGQARPASIGRTLDFLPIAFEPGRAVFQGTPGEAHLNPMGAVHGGWFATLLDSALGCSVQCALPAGKGYTTLELKVNMIRALTPKVQRVRAEGRVIHVGNQTATAEARPVGPDGRLSAHGSPTCRVFELRPQHRAAP